MRVRGNAIRFRLKFVVLLVSLVWLGCTDSRDLTAPDDLGPNIRIVDQVARVGSCARRAGVAQRTRPAALPSPLPAEPHCGACGTDR